MQESLTKVESMFRDSYLTLQKSQNIYIPQTKTLQDTLNTIQKKIDSKTDILSTYETEFNDRTRITKPFTFWRLRGLNTLQDWVLFSFFFVYGLLSLLILLLCFNSEYVIINMSVVILCSFSIAVLLMGVIVRFA